MYKMPLKIEDLSMEQKIGQMMIARLPIDQASLDFTLDLIRRHALGAIQLQHRKTGPGFFFNSELDMMKLVQENADYPILICEDMENGYHAGKVVLPYQMMVGAANDEALAYDYGRITASEAHNDGYNLVLGPILDIAENPESCDVDIRSYGADRELVSRMAAATIRAYQDGGMIVSAKHFPGFGPSPVDSHIGMVVVDQSEEELLEKSLYPYLYAMRKADLSGIMVGHIMVPWIDDRLPASVSPKVIGMLRKHGFDGLVMTDSFSMIGMRTLFTEKECYQLGMAAGNDLIMGNYNGSVRTQYEYMLEAYRKGMATEEQINSAVRHVIAAQNRTLAEPAYDTHLTDADLKRAEEISARGICASCLEGYTPALDRNEKILFVIQTGNLFKDPITGEVESDRMDLEAFTREIRKNFPHAVFSYLPEYPIRPQIEHFLNTTLEYGHIVFVLMTKNISYTGYSDCSKRMIALLHALKTKTEAIVLFGNPYAAREFPETRRVIFGFDGASAQKYAAGALSGKHQVTGLLPVEIGI